MSEVIINGEPIPTHHEVVALVERLRAECPALRARVAELEALANDLTTELSWWVDEHECCKDHAKAVLDRAHVLLNR